MFTSLLPTLFLLIVAVFVINYNLECFVNLGIAYIYHSTHQLFEYKLALVILLFFFEKVVILLLGAKRSQVFYTLSELSYYL